MPSISLRSTIGLLAHPPPAVRDREQSARNSKLSTPAEKPSRTVKLQSRHTKREPFSATSHVTISRICEFRSQRRTEFPYNKGIARQTDFKAAPEVLLLSGSHKTRTLFPLHSQFREFRSQRRTEFPYNKGITRQTDFKAAPEVLAFKR
jgi:hypothetical protein